MSGERQPVGVDRPKIRTDIEITPTQVEGKLLFLVRDSLGLIHAPIGVSRDLLALMSLLDGQRTLVDIRTILTHQQGGTPVPEGEIERILQQLDALMILDNAVYRAARQRMESDFLLAPVRPCILAGHSYPAKREELAAYVDQLLAGSESRRPARSGQVRAVVAPHLELKMAELAYSVAWQALKRQRPERVVILGTGHQLEGALFCLTRKDFETPLGRVATDRDAVEALRTAGGALVAPDDLPHWKEHSIEIQLVFMQRLFGESVEIVPVLCGSIEPYLGRHGRFADIPGAEAMITALRRMEKDRKTLFVASVDLAHVGMRFGHGQPATDLSGSAKIEDGALIKALCAGNAAGFWRRLARVRDVYNVCGAPVLACLLEVLDGGKGTLLDYDMWHDLGTQSAVSYAAVLFGGLRGHSGRRAQAGSGRTRRTMARPGPGRPRGEDD